MVKAAQAGATPATSAPLTGSSLIKALKAAQDPPTPGGPRKIELAQQAWEDDELRVPRKADVVRDWILEAWTRAKPGPTHPILEPAYHALLVTVSPSCAAPAAAALTLLGSYIASAKVATALSEDLSLAVTASFGLLFSAEGQKAEGWAELWTKLVDVLAAPTAPAAELGAVATLVCDALATALPTSSNTKKIAQSLHAQLPNYAAALYHHPEIKAIFEPLTGTLLFPFHTLQTINPLKVLLAPLATDVTPSTDLRPALALLPHLFASFIDQTHKNRFDLYGRTANDQRAIDVLVADKTRAAVIPALGAALELADALENIVLARPSSSGVASQAPLIQALWASRFALWSRFQAWGGYLETDAAAGTLVVTEAKRAASALATYGASDAASIEGEGLAGAILSTLNVLEQLDHDRTALNATVVGWCLASPSRTHAPARTLLASLLRFHQLTHTLPGFFDVLASAVAGLFDPSLPSETLEPIYELVATGPITDKLFRDDLTAAVRSTNLGGRRSGTWASLLDDIAGRVRTALADEAETGSKRKRTSSSESGARLVSVLSRLVKVVLDAGARAKAGDEDTEYAIGAAARAFDAPEPSVEQGEKKKKKRKSDVGVRDLAADLVYAARLRVARSAGLIKRDEYTQGVSVETVCALLTSNAAPELRLQALEYAYTYLALTAHRDDEKRAAVVDAVLSVLGGSSKRPWTGRDASVTEKTLAAASWTVVAEQGLSVLDAVAIPAQLDTLAGLVLSGTDATISEPGAEIYSVSAAVRRALSDANTWELSALRAALLKALTGGGKGAFVVLAACPAPWLSKPARAALLEAAYSADAASEDAETRTAIRTWLARLAASADVLGPLSGDPKLVKKLLKSADEGALAEATLRLVGLLYVHLAKVAPREAAAENTLSALIDDAKAKPFAKLDTRSRATALLFESLIAAGAVDRLSSLKEKLTALATAARSNLAPKVDAALTDPAANAPVFTAWRALSRFTRWLDPATPAGEDVGAKLLSALLRSGAPTPALAVVALELSASTATPESVLAAFIVLHASVGVSELDDALRSYARTLTPEAYGVILSAAVALATTASRNKETAAALRAARILISAPVEGSGRVIATHLHALLLSIERAVSTGSVAVIAESLSVINALLEDRTGLLRDPDAALILTTLTTTLLPSPTPRSPTAAPNLLTLALTLLLTLARHRPDLALQHLPALVGSLAAAFPLLQRARTPTRAARAKAAAKRPFWLALEPSPDVTAGHAALLARTLTALATAKLKDASRLAGPLAKHAPAVLVAYARAAADAWAGLSPAVRRELEPGLFSLCDVVTAGGRGSDGRGREGEGVGGPFGLGEAGGEAEREVWAEVWRAWARKRYTGKG